MNRQETKLLVENWRNLLSKSEEAVILEEGFLDTLGKVKNSIKILALTSSLLGQAALSQEAVAMDPSEISSTLENAFEKKSPGAFSFEVNKSGDVIATHITSGKEQLILTAKQCENVSQEELKDSLAKLRTLGYKSYKRALEKAAETVEEVKNDQSSEKISLADKINSISKVNKKEIIKDFSAGQDGFNLELMQYNIVAKRLFGKDPAFKEYQSKEDIVIYLIMRNYRSYRSYLPSE
jgi:hypothetical protein